MTSSQTLQACPSQCVGIAVQELEKGLDSLEDTYRGDEAAASADAGEAEAADYSEAAVPAGKKSWREALYKGGKKGRPPAKSTRSSHGEALAGPRIASLQPASCMAAASYAAD